MSRFPIKQNAALVQAEADLWNRRQPVGANVTLRLDSGVPFETVTTSSASVQDGRLVIQVKGFSHAWPLNRVRPGWEDHLAVEPL